MHDKMLDGVEEKQAELGTTPEEAVAPAASASLLFVIICVAAFLTSSSVSIPSTFMFHLRVKDVVSNLRLDPPEPILVNAFLRLNVALPRHVRNSLSANSLGFSMPWIEKHAH